jgi:hypothetical protein
MPHMPFDVDERLTAVDVSETVLASPKGQWTCASLLAVATSAYLCS